MASFIKKLFGGSKKKRTQELYAKLLVQVTRAYQGLIQDALDNKNSALIQMRGTGGSNLTVDLSSQGVAHLANNPPSSVTDILHKEDPEVIASAAGIASALVENPSLGGGLSFNPTINEVVSEVLQRELRRRFPAWPS